MRKILVDLFNQCNSGSGKYKEEIHRIDCHKGMLKKNFSKWQKRMLLYIEDDKDLIAEKWAVDSFSEGVKWGVMFMIEVLCNDDG